MTESTETQRVPAPPRPEPPDGPPALPRASISYGLAMVFSALLFVASCGVGFVPEYGLLLAAALGVVFVAGALWFDLLRSQQLVMAEVSWLVLAVIAKLVFLEDMPAAPLPVFAGVLLVQYLAQLVVDLRAFADAGDKVPPVTYAVTFALAPVLAVAAELFRAARMNYAQTAGVALAMALAASLFLLLVIWWDWTRKAFSSLKMAVTLISLIGLGSVAGTMVIQHMPEDSVAAHHEKFMNGEGAAPVNARYLFQDPAVDWSPADEARRVAMNEKFGAGQGDRWEKMVHHDRVKKAKEAEGKRWVKSNADGLQAFYEFCERTQLTRVFKSWYFNALLVLLAGTVVGVMIRRYPYERRDLGWVSAHTGIVFLLLCLAGSDLIVRDGFVQLAPTASPGGSGAPTETKSFKDIFDKDVHGEERDRDFPWTLRLVRTSADWYQELAVAFAGEGDGVGAQQTYPVLAGKVIELERPAKDAPPHYRIEILDVLDRCRTTRVGFKPGKGSGVTALQLLVDDDGKPAERWVSDDDDAPLALPGGQLRFVVAKSEAEVARATGPVLDPAAGTIGFVRVVAGDKELAKIPATIGAKSEFVHDGKTWRATVADASLNMQQALAERGKPAAERTPIERQVVGIMGATLSVESDGVEAQRASAFSGEFSEFANEQMANPVLKQAGLRFYLEFVAPTETRVVARPDGSLVAVEETRAGVGAPRTLRERDALLGAVDAPSIAVGKLVRDAEIDADVEALPAETDADYLKNGLARINEQVGVPAIRVRVTEPESEPYDAWILGGDPWMRTMVLQSHDRRLHMELVSTSESMYRSAVQAIDSHGNVLGEHVVRVNTPFRMSGYEFYQNTFARPDQGGPMSVFRVKYDPFVPWIYVGFVLVASGVITMLWFPGQRAFKLHAHLARLPEEGPKEATP